VKDGYFPRGSSVLRRVQEERAVGLLYGQRALMVGALHPLAFTGTILHTRAAHAPFQRLAHTGKMFERVMFGDRDEADGALRFTEELHERVQGTLPDDAGPLPAGTPYSAFDPELMLWTMACMCDSAEVVYETLVRPLSASEKEDLWSDYVRFAGLFGMPRDAAPGSHAEFRAWWDDLFAGDRLALTDEARLVGHYVAFEIPLPVEGMPARPALNHVLRGTLTARVREHYGLSWSRADEAAYRALISAVRRSRPLVPRALRRGRCEWFFEAVARTERGRIRQGKAGVPLPFG